MNRFGTVKNDVLSNFWVIGRQKVPVAIRLITLATEKRETATFIGKCKYRTGNYSMNFLIPNQLFNRKDAYNTSEKTILQMAKKLQLMLVLVCLTTLGQAQTMLGSDPAPAVKKLSGFVAQLQAIDQNSGSNYSRVDHLNNMLYRVQSSVYFDGTATTYGAKPTVLFTDIANLAGLDNASMPKNSIEMVTLYINSAAQLSGNIDLDHFSSFKKLKYIHIVSKVPTSEKKLTDMVLHWQERLSVFYEIASGDSNQ
jgi:hypothetical protein